MKSLLRLALLIDLLCLSTAGLVIFGLPSPRLFALKSTSNSSNEEQNNNEATADKNIASDNANAFENLVRNVSRNKQCELPQTRCIHTFIACM